jgi:predicted transposase YbfD/YdcC
MHNHDTSEIATVQFIKVERTGIRERKPFEEKVFYMSSLTENAAEFSQRIRAHWHVENRLHWVKDVVLKEDESPLSKVNVFRKEGFPSITNGIRSLAHDVHRLFSFLQ